MEILVRDDDSFATDGEWDIKGAVETIFALCPYTLML